MLDFTSRTYSIHDKPNGSLPATILIYVSPIIANICYVIAENEYYEYLLRTTLCCSTNFAMYWVVV